MGVNSVLINSTCIIVKLIFISNWNVELQRSNFCTKSRWSVFSCIQLGLSIVYCKWFNRFLYSFIGNTPVFLGSCFQSIIQIRLEPLVTKKLDVKSLLLCNSISSRSIRNFSVYDVVKNILCNQSSTFCFSNSTSSFCRLNWF